MKVVILILTLAISACSSEMRSGTSHVGEETVLARIDNLGSRPSWLEEENPFKIENSKVTSLGQTVISADDNISAAYRIAENNAKASVSSAITQKLKFIFQNAEEGTAMGANQARYIGEETSKLTTSYLRLSHRYWEKVRIIRENGEPMIQYRVFASIEMPEEKFKESIFDVLRAGEGKVGLTREFAEKVNKEWDKFSNDQEDNQSSANKAK